MKALFLLLFALSAQAEIPSRVEQDLEAKKQFLGLTFFAEGRGMHMSPQIIDHFNDLMKILPSPKDRNQDLRTLFTRRWGLQIENKNVVGLFRAKHDGLAVGAIGCVACHSGRVAGQFVVGVGNKNIDVLQMAKDLVHLENLWKDLVPAWKKSATYIADEQDALAFAGYLSNEKTGNLTQGLVPVSFVASWFYRIHGEALPENMGRGQVKVPALWGYGEKRPVGLFSDGFGDGTEAGWAVLVELTAGQHPETVRAYYPEVKKAEELFSQFLPPAYPFKVDQTQAEKGRGLFNQSCAHCHGTYEKDADGLPLYQAPRWIPLSVVKTDSDRAMLFNTDEFRAMVDRNPLRDLITYRKQDPGYFAPRLVGIWARFPYLHNNSVPNIRALLTPPEDRPTLFALKDAGEKSRFDENALGLTLPSWAGEKLLWWEAVTGNRSVYFTQREGHSNQGHNFYTDLADEEKNALIEYLKTI